METCNHCPVLSEWIIHDCTCDAISSATEISERSCTFADTNESAGTLCAVNLTQITECSLGDSNENNGCPVWGTWLEWSDCSILCYNDESQTDFGHKIRKRECSNGSVNDPSGACPAADYMEDVLCDLSEIPSCEDHFQFSTVSPSEVVEKTRIYIDFMVITNIS